MYTCDGMKKYREQMKEAIAEYMAIPAEDLKVSISAGNRKIGHVLNVSLPPLFTCGNCSECARYCYDIKACIQYKNVLKARARNYAILTRNAVEYWEQIRGKMARRKKNLFFRFHVAGDIVNAEYLRNMIETAKMFPLWTIWTYTKEYAIVNEYVRKHGGSREKAIPANLHIMFSEWRGLPMVNPYGFPVFRCVFRNVEKAPENEWQCPGNCNICKAMGRGCVVGESSYTWDH